MMRIFFGGIGQLEGMGFVGYSMIVIVRVEGIYLLNLLYVHSMGVVGRGLKFLDLASGSFSIRIDRCGYGLEGSLTRTEAFTM